MRLGQAMMGVRRFGNRRWRWALGAVLAAAATAGCGAESSGEPLGQWASAIAGGYADTVDHAVVGLRQEASEGTYICTGTLIASNVVLTARHCVAETPSIIACPATEFGPTVAPETLLVTTEAVMPSGTTEGYRAVEQVLVPEGAPTICSRDVALLVLTAPIDGAEATPLDPSLDTPTQPDTVYSAVGFGQTSPDGTGTIGERYRRDDMVVDCAGQECIPGFIWDGEWVGDAGLCGGDSGGPALDAEERVFGIASRSGLNCDAPMYVDLAGWSDWIRVSTRDATTQAGVAVPAWTEPPPDPVTPDSSDDEDDGGCSIGSAPVSSSRSPAWLSVALLAAGAWLCRRRR